MISLTCLRGVSVASWLLNEYTDFNEVFVYSWRGRDATIYENLFICLRDILMCNLFGGLKSLSLALYNSNDSLEEFFLFNLDHCNRSLVVTKLLYNL